MIIFGSLACIAVKEAYHLLEQVGQVTLAWLAGGFVQQNLQRMSFSDSVCSRTKFETMRTGSLIARLV